MQNEDISSMRECKDEQCKCMWNIKGKCFYDGKSCDMFRAIKIDPEDLPPMDHLEFRCISSLDEIPQNLLKNAKIEMHCHVEYGKKFTQDFWSCEARCNEYLVCKGWHEENS